MELKDTFVFTGQKRKREGKNAHYENIDKDLVKEYPLVKTQKVRDCNTLYLSGIAGDFLPKSASKRKPSTAINKNCANVTMFPHPGCFLHSD